MFKSGNKAQVSTPATPAEVREGTEEIQEVEGCQCAAELSRLREQLEDLIDRTRSGVHPSSPRGVRERAAEREWVEALAARWREKDEASLQRQQAEFLEEWNRERTFPVDRQMFGRRLAVGPGVDDPEFRSK